MRKDPLPLPEFIALVGLMFAIVAFSIDAMLPALDEIAEELTPNAPNRAQLIITSFVLGMGLGTFVAGPLSDAFGRKAVILSGAVIYVAGALLALMAPTLELLLAARVLQGLGAAAPRTATMALVRDLYSGRQMARILSFCMIVFTLVPAMAPLIGTGIIALWSWRGIFGAFVLFNLVMIVWLGLRQPETLPPAERRPFRVAPLWAGTKEILANRQVMMTVAVLGLTFGMLFATLSLTQPVFRVSFDEDAAFPWWFAAISLSAGLSGFLNARLVMVLGMRRVVALAFTVQAALSALCIAGFAAGLLGFHVYVAWVFTLFFMAGMTIGNLNALAMEPLGHIAGLGASVISAVATIAGVAIAVPLGLAFDGTPLPHIAGVLVCAVLGAGLIQMVPRDRPALAGD